jgi:hypothetical protein
MLNLGVFLTIFLGAGSSLFYIAGELRSRVGWANDLCTAALPICMNPEWPAMAAAVLICAVLILKLAMGSRI